MRIHVLVRRGEKVGDGRRVVGGVKTLFGVCALMGLCSRFHFGPGRGVARNRSTRVGRSLHVLGVRCRVGSIHLIMGSGGGLARLVFAGA